MIVYNNSAPKTVNNVGQFGATEGSIGAYKSAAEYAADAKYWALLSQTKYSSVEEILAEVERLYAQGRLLEEDIKQLKSDFETQEQTLLGLIQSTGAAIDNTNAATELSKEATQNVLAQLDIISNMTVQTTLLPPGSLATGSYNNLTGEFSFGIPEGRPGRDGTDGSISDINNVPEGIPTSEDLGFYVDSDDGGLYKTSMQNIASLLPFVHSVSINGGLPQTGDVSFDSVSSFNSRKGVVIPQTGDYSVDQITGAASSGVNNDITRLAGLSTAITVEQGGTGAITASGARDSLGLGAVSTESIVPISKGGTGVTSQSSLWTVVRPSGVTPLSSDPVSDGDAATKRYVDNSAALTTSNIKSTLLLPQGASLIGVEPSGTVQSFLNSLESSIEAIQSKHTPDISTFGYTYGSGLDAKEHILSAIGEFGYAELSGNITLSRFDWPQGARLVGKSTITYARLPGVSCKLDSDTPVDHSLIKAVYVHQAYDICDMLQLKTAGFNTIIHYGQFGSSGGTMPKVCNAAEAVGINVILGGTTYGQTNAPNQGLDNRDCVIGYYLFDEPQNNSITRSEQETRITNFRAFTQKMLTMAEHGVFGFDTNTHPSGYNGIGYDLIFCDAYYHDDWDDARNKRQAVLGWGEMKFKCPNAKLIPCVGLFTTDAGAGSDNFKNKAKQISFAKQFYGMGNGNYAAFAWESNLIASTHKTVTTDSDLYKLGFDLNSRTETKPYDIDVYAGYTDKLSGLIQAYNPTYSADTVKPWQTINTGAATNDRNTTFKQGGIGVKNLGGNFATNLKNSGYIAVEMYLFNGADSTNTNVAIRTFIDDFFTPTSYASTTLTPSSTAWINSAEVAPGLPVSLAIVPSASYDKPWKILSGGIVDCSWRTASF